MDFDDSYTFLYGNDYRHRVEVGNAGDQFFAVVMTNQDPQPPLGPFDEYGAAWQAAIDTLTWDEASDLLFYRHGQGWFARFGGKVHGPYERPSDAQAATYGLARWA